MSNDTQKPKNPWLDYGNTATARSIVGTLLKFSRGYFVAGADDRAIPTGTEMVADMNSIAANWVRWENGMATEHRMGLVADSFISELGDNNRELWETDAEGQPRDPWQFRTTILLDPKNDLEVAFEKEGGGPTTSRHQRGPPYDYPSTTEPTEEIEHCPSQTVVLRSHWISTECGIASAIPESCVVYRRRPVVRH
jgi:hypothetical protein